MLDLFHIALELPDRLTPFLHTRATGLHLSPREFFVTVRCVSCVQCISCVTCVRCVSCFGASRATHTSHFLAKTAVWSSRREAATISDTSDTSDTSAPPSHSGEGCPIQQAWRSRSSGAERRRPRGLTVSTAI